MSHQTPSATRLLSTSARVHPPYLPYIHNASRTKTKGLKWLPPVAAVVTAGYAITAYREAQAAHQHEQAEFERRRRNAAMADAYGERDSLEELERAVRVYELAQQQQQQQQQGR